MATSKTTKYYVRDSVVPFEEDALHEFKGHRNLASEELPPWSQDTTHQLKVSRRAVSRNLNGFLNTGSGGLTYLGIIDNGTVKGLELTQYQKDHVTVSMDDLMGRYNPPVLPHRYKVKFVPVLDKGLSEEAKLQHCLYESSCQEASSDTERRRPHQLRTHYYCWCDKDAVAQRNIGRIPPSYIVEIMIKPWDRTDHRNMESAETEANLHPIHEDETGLSHFKRQASLLRYTKNEIAEMTRKEVREFYDPEIVRLKQDIEKCRKQLRQRAKP